MENNNLPGTGVYSEPGPGGVTALEKAPAARKGFPFFGIPALVMLFLMMLVFGLEIYLSFHKVNIIHLAASPAIGTQNYERLLRLREYIYGISATSRFRAVQIAGSGLLAAAFCALYYAIRKPKAVLTFACLWLIPACLPYYSTALLFLSPAVHSGDSGVLLYLLTSVLQMTSIFCFFGGLFTYINLLKSGKAGGWPYYGLLVAVLVWMLSPMTTNAMYNGGMAAILTDRTVDMFNFRMVGSMAQYGVGAAGGVFKIVLQVLGAVIPVVVLSILGRKKSTLGRTPLATVWVFLAVPAGVILALVLGMFPTDRMGSAIFRSVVTVLIGGSFGGLIAYSFIHLLRRVPSFLFAVIGVVLASALSCLASQMIVMKNLGLRDTVLPQVLLAAFDGRLVLIVTALAFALRSHSEARPGSLVVAAALLAGAFVWGEINVAALHSNRMMTVSLYTMNIMNNSMAMSTLDTAATAEVAGEAARNAANTYRTVAQLVLAIPPLLLGTGAALMMRHSFAVPDETLRG